MSFEHIHPEFRHLMNLSDEERMAFVKQPRWISYPGADRLISTLRGLMETPTQARMPCLLVVGDSNNGKTTIVRRFMQVHGQRYENPEAEPVAPAILAEAAPGGDERALYTAILDQFYCPYRESI